MTVDPQRRNVLYAIGTAGTVAIAGCSSSADDGSSGDGGDDGGDSSGGSDDGEEWVQTDTVDMTDELTFEPYRIEVEAGTTVVWENVGSVGHTITAYEDEIPGDAEYFASGGFDTQDAAVEGYPDEGNVEGGASWEYTFETPGEYKYYCIPHEMNGMDGYVKVI